MRTLAALTALILTACGGGFEDPAAPAVSAALEPGQDPDAAQPLPPAAPVAEVPSAPAGPAPAAPAAEPEHAPAPTPDPIVTDPAPVVPEPAPAPAPAPAAPAPAAPEPPAAYGGRALINGAWGDAGGWDQLQCVSPNDCSACVRALVEADLHETAQCVYLPCDDASPACGEGLDCLPATEESGAPTVCRELRAGWLQPCTSSNDCEPGLSCRVSQRGLTCGMQ